MPAGARRRAVSILATLAVVVLALDALTKQLVLTYLPGRPPPRLLGGAVYLVLTRNGGAAFSIGNHYTYIFPVITVLVIGVIFWISRRLASVPWAISLGLILGGALGNLTDRVFRAPGFPVGHVVDFVSVFADDGHVFPIFNLADSALTCGVVLAIILELTGRRRDGGRLPDTGPAPLPDHGDR